MDKKKYSKKGKGNLAEAKASSDKLKYRIILGLIVVFTFMLFAKSLNFQFVNWDDNSYIVDNIAITNFSFEGFKNIFTTPVLGMYNPLTFVVYTIEHRISGLDPATFHFVNIIFHLLAVIVTFNFIYALTRKYQTATIVTLLFAIHPMHVTVVTWVSETKTSLYVIFYFLALLNYLKYVRSGYQIKYIINTGMLFLLAVLSKPSAVTLAPMLLLLDYYLSRKIDKRLILEKIPFFLISLLFGILTIVTHMDAEDSIFESNQDFSLINNLLVSNYSIVFYINKLFVPLDLCTIYPYPGNDPVLPLKYYFSIPVIPLLIWLVYKAGSFRKEMIFGILFFVISISVVLRIVPSGFFRASNVYTYLSYTGFFFIIGQFYTYVLENRFSFSGRIKNYTVLFVVALVIFYTVRTNIRINVWENSITLFDDIILKKPKLALAYSNRAVSKLNIGDTQGALDDLTKCIELDPKYAAAYSNRGKILTDLKDYDSAMKDVNTALALNPKYAEAYINRGNVMFYWGKYDEASADYDSAIRYGPNIATAYKNRSSVKMLQKNDAEALKDLNKALAINPKFFDAFIDRGNLRYRLGRVTDAMADYNSAIRINPKSGQAYYNRALMKLVQRDTLGAESDEEIAVRLGFRTSQ